MEMHKNHAIRYRHPKSKNKTNKGIKAYGFPVFLKNSHKINLKNEL
jgi:hypothetical protein